MSSSLGDLVRSVSQDNCCFWVPFSVFEAGNHSKEEKRSNSSLFHIEIAIEYTQLSSSIHHQPLQSYVYPYRSPFKYISTRLKFQDVSPRAASMQLQRRFLRQGGTQSKNARSDVGDAFAWKSSQRRQKRSRKRSVFVQSFDLAR